MPAARIFYLSPAKGSAVMAMLNTGVSPPGRWLGASAPVIQTVSHRQLHIHEQEVEGSRASRSRPDRRFRPDQRYAGPVQARRVHPGHRFVLDHQNASRMRRAEPLLRSSPLARESLALQRAEPRQMNVPPVSSPRCRCQGAPKRKNSRRTNGQSRPRACSAGYRCARPGRTGRGCSRAGRRGCQRPCRDRKKQSHHPFRGVGHGP
jgi:hypothetical protein